MSRLPNHLVPELPILQAVALNLLRPAGPAVRKFTRDVFDRLEKPVLLCDCQGRCLFYNASFTALNGGEVVLAELDLAGGELKRILDLDIPVLQFRDQLIVTGGKKVPVLLDIHPVANERGERLGSAVLVTDLREKLAARTTWHQMSCALDVVQAGVIGLTPEGEITICNRSARMLLGLENIDVEGMSLNQVMEIIKVEPRKLLSALTVEGGQDCREVELYAGRRFFRVESPYLSDSAGRVVVIHEVNRFAAGTCREITTQLATIRAFIQVWQHRAKENSWEGFDGFAEVVTSELDQVNSIISGFLTMDNVCPPAEDGTSEED